MWSDIKTQLDRVSRSFALCIPLLEDGLKETVGISYLLLRALDSIEDSEIERKKKEELYAHFSELIIKNDGDRLALISILENQEWKGIKEAEATFMNSGAFARTIDYYWELEESNRLIISSCIQEMTFGMKKYSLTGSDSNLVTIELGQYIHLNEKT